MKTRSLIATAIAASALAAPAAATAADLYVQSGAGVTTCAQDDPCSLAQAVAVADIVSNRDSIHIVGPFSSTQAVDLTHSPIDLIGSGRGAGGTVFSGHDAQIKIGADSSATGFALTADSCAVRITAGGTLRDASLSSPSCGIDVDAAGAGASLIDNVDVDGGAGTGINVHGGISGEETTIRGSDVRAHVGINVSTTTGFTLERSTVESDHTAVAVAHASAAISNSLLRVVATGGRGVDAYGSIVAVDATTIDGTGLGAEGVYGDPAGGAQVTVAGSIVRNFTHDLTAAAPVAILFVSSSDFGTTSGDRLIARGGNINADPHWRNAAAGDYRPTPGSPVIDKGVAGPAATGETDRAGKSRVEDGDHDGTATRDIGAFEYQPSEPEPAPAPTGGGTDPMTSGQQPQAPAVGDDQQPVGGGDQQPAATQQQPPAPVQPGPVAAALKLTLGGRTLTLDKRGRGSVSAGCSANPCGVKLTVASGKHALTTVSGRAGTLKVRLSRAYLKKHRVHRVTIRATVTDALGRQASAAKTFTVRY